MGALCRASSSRPSRGDSSAGASGPAATALLRCWALLLLHLPAALGATEYDPDLRIETAWLYGNMNKYAYYFTDLLIGSKTPQRASVIVDTGSRLVGFPCRGCMHCGDHLDPAYDVSRSESARWLNCSSSCKATCFKAHCPYTETYSEGSTISGFWFDDLVELGDSFQKNPPVRAQLGCHTNENKLFYSQRANGIMGLAPSVAGSTGGRPTILQQLFQDREHVNTEMFSICLATWGGRLTVGGYNDTYHVKREEQGSSNIQWLNMRASHYYFVFPDGLTMGDGDGVQIASGHHTFGVTIVDSGTTYTYLPGPVYRDVVSRLDEHCREHGCGATKEGVDCWRLAEPLGRPDEFPKLTLHFGEGIRVDWPPDGYLHERGETGVWCQTFAENNIFQTVLGISWMIHKDIIFDLAHNQLGVARAACPEHRRQPDLIRRFADASADFREKPEAMPPRKRESPSTSASSPFRRSVVAALVAASLGLVTTVAVLAAALRSASRVRAERGTRLPKEDCLVQTAEEVSLMSFGPEALSSSQSCGRR